MLWFLARYTLTILGALLALILVLDTINTPLPWTSKLAIQALLNMVTFGVLLYWSKP